MDDNLLLLIGEIKGTQAQVLSALTDVNAKLDKHIDGHRDSRHFTVGQASNWLLSLGAIAVAVFRK